MDGISKDIFPRYHVRLEIRSPRCILIDHHLAQSHFGRTTPYRKASQTVRPARSVYTALPTTSVP